MAAQEQGLDTAQMVVGRTELGDGQGNEQEQEAKSQSNEMVVGRKTSLLQMKSRAMYDGGCKHRTRKVEVRVEGDVFALMYVLIKSE